MVTPDMLRTQSLTGATRLSLLIALQQEFSEIGITSKIIDDRVKRELINLEALGRLAH